MKKSSYYQAVIFDLDGTLLNTIEDLARAGNQVLTRLGLAPYPVAAYHAFVGDGMRCLAKRLLPAPLSSQEHEVDAAFSALTAAYSACWHTQTRPYAGIVPLLDFLFASGRKLAVFSNKMQDFTELCVAYFFPHAPFFPIFGQRLGVPKKPDPAGALEIARLLNIAPDRILFVGDTKIDMLTARAAGMDGVGALWGFRDATELEAAGAAALMKNPEELLRFFAEGAS